MCSMATCYGHVSRVLVMPDVDLDFTIFNIFGWASSLIHNIVPITPDSPRLSISCSDTSEPRCWVVLMLRWAVRILMK